jgi:GntR family transcriptional repressor for pyruvate dehydrogenase complex
LGAPFNLTKDNLSDMVFNLLKEMILEGKWKVNEKIPSEIELCTMFGVSRLTVRVALDKLNTLGLLDTKVGKGTYVKSFDLSKYFEYLYDLSPSNESIINDVYEFRKTIEMRCFEMIIKQDEKVDFTALENYDTQMCKTVFKKGDPRFQKLILEHATLDFSFHLEICRLSKNELLFLSYQMAKIPIIRYLEVLLKKRIDEVVKVNNKKPFVIDDVLFKYYSHKAIITFLKNKDLEGYKKQFEKINNYNYCAKLV